MPSRALPHLRERNLAIVEARKSGKTYRKIGKMFGISTAQARVVSVREALRQQAIGNELPADFLSVRAELVISNYFDLCGDRSKITRAMVAAVSRLELKKVPNCGLVTIREIDKWLASGGLSFSETESERAEREKKSAMLTRKSISHLLAQGYEISPSNK